MRQHPDEVGQSGTFTRLDRLSRRPLFERAFFSVMQSHAALSIFASQLSCFNRDLVAADSLANGKEQKGAPENSDVHEHKKKNLHYQFTRKNPVCRSIIKFTSWRALEVGRWFSWIYKEREERVNYALKNEKWKKEWVCLSANAGNRSLVKLESVTSEIMEVAFNEAALFRDTLLLHAKQIRHISLGMCLF